MAQDVIVRIQGLNKTFRGRAGTVVALNGIDLDIYRGEIFGIIGLSGAGKSTLVRCINFLEKPTEGTVTVDGQELGKLSKKQLLEARRSMGMIFQQFNLLQQRTALQNICFPLEIAGTSKVDAEKRARELLEIVGLSDRADNYPSQLSGGQQQRVAFARAIVIEPACILFDEPLSALDALLREEMRSELRTLITKLGITGVFVTHDQIEAMSMSDAIAVCHAGKVEQYDTPEKIYSHPATEFVARFVGSSNWLDQNHLFRPEQAQTVPAEQAEKYDADVTAVQFLGSSYQLQLNHNGQNWTYISPRRVSVGEKLSLYLPRSAIVAV